MTARRKLPHRRRSETIEYEKDGNRFRLAAGYYPDGAIGELFLNVGKTSSALDVLVSDAAILTSLALQYGCPLDVLQHAVKRDSQGRAASPVGEALDRLGRLS
jgi:hypothetical protein